MSPEQWKNSKNVDWRADAYSLGCVAFEMVAGRPPFVAETIGEACAKHLTEEPPRLSSLVFTPAPLDNLIASLLAKHPEQRPSTMRDIGNAFSALATANQLGFAATMPPPSSYGAGMSAPIPMLVPRTEAVHAHAPNTTLGAAAASAPVAKPAGNRTLIFVLLVAIGGLGLIGAMVALVMSSTEDTRAAAVAAREEVVREQARAVEEALAEARKRDAVATPIVTPDAGPVEAPVAGPAALGADEIQAMAAKQTAATTSCFRRAEKTADARVLASVSKITVTFSVAASGTVSDVQLSDNLEATSFGKCLEAKVREWKFRASPGGTFRFTIAKPQIDHAVARAKDPGRSSVADATVANTADDAKASRGEAPVAKPSCDEVSCILQGSLDSYPKGHCCAKFRKGEKKPAVPVEAEASSTASGLPEALDRSMISAGIGAVKSRVAGCAAKSSAKGQVKVSVKVSPDGSVASASIKQTPDPALGSCVASTIQRARFAKTQAGGSFTYPFVF
jgi:TonB family protein